MTALSTMIRLRAVQNKTRELFKDMSDIHYRLQFHHDLSPAGWHLGHGLFIENYWIHEVIQGNDKYTADKSLFIPENCPKAERGPRLPTLNKLLETMQTQQDNNAILLMNMVPPMSDHPLFKNEYIHNFIIQHYAQHYETIHMVLNQIAIKQDKRDYQPEQILKSSPPRKTISIIPEGDYIVGDNSPLAYDNEQPTNTIHLNETYISSVPVSNAEFLFFIQQGGYSNPDYWSEQGWQWLSDQQIQQPEHWMQNTNKQWYGINENGPHDLSPEHAVYGISHFEASAYANFAGARLCHEHEWESATRLQLLKHNAQCWEWCDNTFSPYPDFRAFPYDEYSKPWFDDNHYVLRGGSAHTRPEIKRASFRNFFQPHQRHIFAGLRLAFDTP